VAQLGFTVTTGVLEALQRYQARKLAGVTAIMRETEQRVYENTQAVPGWLRTGHMRANLIRQSDVAELQYFYRVFWRASEFVGQVNPWGELITEFYPYTITVPAGSKYEGLLVRQNAEEQPVLMKKLRHLFRGVA
jgi:hypothetical protein